MSLDFHSPDLELLHLEASLAQQEAQANETRALLAHLKHSQSAYSPTDAGFQYTTSTASPRHGSQTSSPSLGGPGLPLGGQPALYQQNSYTPMKRVKTCQPGLQQPMPGPTNMVRSKSSYATPNPFTAGPGPVKPVPVPQGQMSMTSFPDQIEQHQSSTPNMDHSMDSFMGVPHHSSGLFPVMEHGSIMGTGTMENPGDFLQRLQGVNIPRNQRTIPLYGQDTHMNTAAYQTVQSRDLSPSQCGSLTSGPTFSDMSRSNSNANQSVSGQMISFDSQSSFADGISTPEFNYSPDQQPSPNKKRSAPGEDVVGTLSSSLSGAFANLPPPVHMGRSTSIDSRLSSGHSQHAPASLHRHLSLQSRPMQRSESQLSRQSFTSGAMQGFPVEQGESMMRGVSGSSDRPTASQRELSRAIRDAAAKHGESMARTISASSARSTQSQRQQRHNDALKSHIAHAEMQPLAPKPKADNSPTSAPSDTKTGVDGKVAMPRTLGYQRPKRPKISCEQCDENPDGFRGEHELRRHKDLKHSKEFKRFVCRTPSQLGAESDLQPIYPLEKCKHCTSNKEYGQYYNAAAHLRRAHFTKKPPRASRSKNGHANGSDEPNEKRGGKGGGDWPPMSELKAKWMEEIKSANSANDAATISDEDNTHDMEMFEGAPGYHPYMTAPTTGFDDTAASFVGSAAHLQVQNADVYTDTFNAADLNYTTSTSSAVAMHHHEYDPSAVTSTGSANFDFNASPAGGGGGGGGFHPHDLPIDLHLSGMAFQSPHNSTSTATLTPFHAFGGGQEGQFTQKAGSSGPMMMPQQPDMLEDMDFGLAMGAEYDDGTFHRA